MWSYDGVIVSAAVLSIINYNQSWLNLQLLITQQNIATTTWTLKKSSDFVVHF